MPDDHAAMARKNFEVERTIAIVGALIMIAKFVAYFLTDSVSILTDALESIVNVVAGVIGVYALWMCLVPADREHPYGHGKMELISSNMEGMMILAAGLLIILESVNRFLNPTEIRQIDIGLVIVIISAILNFVMGASAIRIGKRTGSMALEASGKHLCTDTYSSIGIIIGLALIYIAATMGYDAWWLDPLTAIIFGALIIVTGVRVVIEATGSIIDTADEDALRDVTRAINHVRSEDVIDVHHLRVVKYGSLLHVEMHMVVPDDMHMKDVDDLRHTLVHQIQAELSMDSDITIQAECCSSHACTHCIITDCNHRKAPFRSNVVLHVENVRSELPPSRREED